MHCPQLPIVLNRDAWLSRACQPYYRRWDYGYQTTAMANRTVLVDNNTWNNTHIATVGRAMASPERRAWEIYRSLDVTHVLVVFGGFIGCAPHSPSTALCGSRPR